MEFLTVGEMATNFETQKHINTVRRVMLRFMHELEARADDHDMSKLERPEVTGFENITKSLGGLTYGSPEYRQALRWEKPTIDHHYAMNRHHPEHFGEGVSGMNLIDVVEMLCDWLAATERHDDGDIWKSLEVNRARFGISDQLMQVLSNTVRFLQK